MTLTLRARLAVVYTVVIGLLLVGLSLMSYRILARQLDADVTARLTELTDGLHGYLHFDGDQPGLVFDRQDSDQAAFVHEATRYYQIYDATSGRLLVQSDGFEPLGLHFTPAEVHAFREQPLPFDIRTDYGRFRVSNSLIVRGDRDVDLLQVGASLAAMDGTLGRYRNLLLWRVPPALLVAALAAWWMAGIALAPLSRVAAVAGTIDVMSLSRRLPLRGAGDELDDVVQAFNETLTRLEQAVQEMRQFSAALAHELRTPLAALRGEIELALRRPGLDDQQRSGFGSQLEELDRLKRLIDQILTLARAEAGQIQLSFAPVDLGELGVALVEQLEPVAQARGIDLRCDRSGPVFVEGDAGWLRRLLLNLLDNALKFTGEGGHVALRLTNVKDEVRMDVRDTGIGMAADVTPRIFDRFFRADPSRSSALDGAGLGLSLVKCIAERHHGRVMVESATGEGSTFSVWLPRTHGTRAVPRQMIAS
jgi:two-component system OmpR family sensor kinase